MVNALPSVLIAADAPAQRRLGGILQGYRCFYVASMQPLASALRGGDFDLIMIDAAFDGCNAIEALGHSLRNRKHATIVSVRAQALCGKLGHGTREAFRAACGELGVDCFLDLLEFPEDAAGNARVRKMLERLVRVH
jgi:CheY-like chemotaxis protein